MTECIIDVISASLRVPKEVPLQFTHFPPAIPRLDSTDIHTYPALKRQVWGCVNEGEEGELGIGLPPNSITKFIPEITVGETEKKEKVKDEWEQITISVEYEVREPGAGIVIAGPDQANPSVNYFIFWV